MKYMILLCGSQRDYDSMSGQDAAGRDPWTGADFAALGAFMESFTKDLATSGELVDTRGLTAPVHARRIRLDNGVVALITGTLGRGPAEPYQLQAAVAAVHDEAPSAGATDWPQIMALYEVRS